MVSRCDEQSDIVKLIYFILDSMMHQWMEAAQCTDGLKAKAWRGVPRTVSRIHRWMQKSQNPRLRLKPGPLMDVRSQHPWMHLRRADFKTACVRSESIRHPLADGQIEVM